MHVIESKPQGIADQVGEKKIRTCMSFNLSRKVYLMRVSGYLELWKLYRMKTKRLE